MSDDALTVCPECNGTIRRILFPAGIVFKGSGFYKTDHGSSAAINETNHNGQQKDKHDNPEKEAATTKAESGNEKKSSGDEKASKAAPASDSKVSAAAD